MYETYSSNFHIIKQWTLRNVTLLDIQAIVAAIQPSDLWDTYVTKHLNDYNLFDGQIYSKSVNQSSGDLFYFRPGDSEDDVQYRQVKGKMLKVVTTYTYDIEKAVGENTGRAHYSGVGGPSPGKTPKNRSFFRSLGRDWYSYKKVTNISSAFTDVTSSYVDGGTINTP